MDIFFRTWPADDIRVTVERDAIFVDLKAGFVYHADTYVRPGSRLLVTDVVASLPNLVFVAFITDAYREIIARSRWA